jgi:hypothetical protein
MESEAKDRYTSDGVRILKKLFLLVQNEYLGFAKYQIRILLPDFMFTYHR